MIQQCLQRSNIPIALVTSSDQASVMNKITHHPWLGPWTTMVCGDDPELEARQTGGRSCPLLAAKRLNVQPKLCWALEDSEAGNSVRDNSGMHGLEAHRRRTSSESLTSRRLNRSMIVELTLITDLNEARQCLEALISTNG